MRRTTRAQRDPITAQDTSDPGGESSLVSRSVRHQAISLPKALGERQNWQERLASSKDFQSAANFYAPNSSSSFAVRDNGEILGSYDLYGNTPTTALFAHGGPSGTGAGLSNITESEWEVIGNHTSVVYVLGCDFAAGSGWNNAQNVANVSGATIYASPFVTQYSSLGPVRSAVQISVGSDRKLTGHES